MSNLLTAGLLVGCLWAVMCRLAMLQASWGTALVAFQHFALGLGAFGALLLPPMQGGHTALVVGVSVFLSAGAARWRFKPPGSLGGVIEVRT